MTKEETINIPLAEYKDLKQAALKLQCLKNAGVDNWDWYDDAMEEFNKGEQS